MDSQTTSDTPSQKPPTSAPHDSSDSVIQRLLSFLDGNLVKFSRPVRDTIGLGVLGLLVVVVLNGFVASTYVEGHLLVQNSADEVRSLARRYFMVRGNETVLTNDNGFWMFPMKGFIPLSHLIQVSDSTGKSVAVFRIRGPWPILSALRTADYTVTLKPYETLASQQVQISQAAGEGILGFARQVTGVQTAYAQPVVARSTAPNVMVHVQGLGDLGCRNGGWCGTKGESRRLEGFALRLPADLNDVQVRYMCHVQDVGDSQWVNGGEFCGTKGRAKRLEGFAIELTGRGASQYALTYQAHLQGIGDGRVYSSGQFAGTRGQGRRVESIRVQIERRPVRSMGK